MSLDPLSSWIVSVLLLGLRIAPVFAFAPPFSLIRTPRLFRVLFGLGLSVCLVTANPQTATLADTSFSHIALAAARELMLGTMFVLAFQLVFGALYWVGRTVDIQAGYGLALLIDPMSRSQTPLIGTLFAYAAAAVFFAVDGHVELLRVLAASLNAFPLGTWTMPGSIEQVTAFISVIFLTALGVAGSVILALFLVDIAVALLSRTAPQMNVLILGIQVKTIVTLLVLPASFGLGGALLLRLMAMTLEALPRML